MVSPISSLGSGITPANRRGVTIKVRADTRAAEADLGRLTRSVEGMSTKFSKMAASVKVAVAAIGGLAALSGATHGISRVSDSLTEMENRIALVTGRGAELNITLERLRRISASTRTSVASSADIYNRFGVALKSSNVSAADLFKVTEVLQKSIAISGSSAVSAEAALMQLGQAMASGELRGEEFNSVNEQMSRVMIALENQLGKTRGELRAMAKDGQLTSDVVFKAILADAENVNREFEQLDATTRSLATVLGDEFKLAITNLDRAVGISDSIRAKVRFITKALQGFNRNFDSIALNVRVNVNKIQNYFAELSTSVQNYLRTTFGGSRWDGAFGGLKKAYGWVKTFINDIIELFRNAWDVIVGNSYWPEIFYEGSRSIAGSNTKAAMDVALEWIGKFIDKVTDWFAKGYQAVSQIWGNLGNAIKSQDFSFDVVFDKLDFVGDWLSWLNDRTEEMAAGMVVILSAMFRVGFKRSIAAGLAVAFAPDVLNSESFQSSLKNFGRGIGKTLGLILSDDEAGKSIIKGLTDSLKAFGSGVWEGIWPEAPFKNGFTDFLAGVFGAGIILLALKPALIVDIAAALFAAGTSSKVTDAAKDLGGKLSNKISSRFRTSLKVGIGSAIIYALSQADFGGEGGENSLGKRVASAALDIALWSAQGAAIGSMFGPVGSIGGLILGGVLGALVGAFNALTRDGELLNDLGAWISETSTYYGQALVDGLHGAQDAVNEWFKGLWTSIRDAVVEGFNGATESVSNWLKNIFSFNEFVPNDAVAPSNSQVLPRSGGSNNSSDIEDYLRSVNGYKSGGYISGPGTGTSDSVPAMLSNGEFVVKASSVSKYGTGMLSMLNDGTLPKFATGGFVGTLEATTGLEGSKRLAGFLGALLMGSNEDATSLGLDALLTDKFNSNNNKGRLSNLFSGSADEDVYDLAIETLKSILESGIMGLGLAKFPGIGSLLGTVATLTDVLLQPLQGVIQYFLKTGSINRNSWKGKAAELMVNATTLTDLRDRLLSGPADLLSNISDAAGSAFSSFTSWLGFKDGGYISGDGGPTEDKIPAMLSNGEFVVKASSVSKYGPGFLGMINNGTLPKFAGGGLVGFNGNEISELKSQLAQAEAERNRIVTKNKMMQLDDPGYIPQPTTHVDDSIIALSERINYLSKQAATNAEASTDVPGDILVPGASGSTGGKTEKKQEERPEFAESIASSISHALRTGDIKGAFESLADSFTSRVIQDFSDGMADAIAGSIDFEGLFKDIKGLGAKLFENVDFGKIFSGLGDTLKNIFSGLGDILSGGGGDGGFLSLVGSFLGFDQGGMVPNIPGSQIGKDSVPALLKPGERVMSRSEVANRTVQGKGGMTTAKFDINVTGDVSRQTRREILDMIPQIAQGVNSENRETNFQYR